MITVIVNSGSQLEELTSVMKGAGYVYANVKECEGNFKSLQVLATYSKEELR